MCQICVTNGVFSKRELRGKTLESFILAEREGFEPSIPLKGIHDFQSCLALSVGVCFSLTKWRKTWYFTAFADSGFLYLSIRFGKGFSLMCQKCIKLDKKRKLIAPSFFRFSYYFSFLFSVPVSSATVPHDI